MEEETKGEERRRWLLSCRRVSRERNDEVPGVFGAIDRIGEEEEDDDDEEEEERGNL